MTHWPPKKIGLRICTLSSNNILPSIFGDGLIMIYPEMMYTPYLEKTSAFLPPDHPTRSLTACIKEGQIVARASHMIPGKILSCRVDLVARNRDSSLTFRVTDFGQKWRRKLPVRSSRLHQRPRLELSGAQCRALLHHRRPYTDRPTWKGQKRQQNHRRTSRHLNI